MLTPLTPKDIRRVRYQELIFVIDLESSSGHNRRCVGRNLDKTSGDIIGIGAACMVMNEDNEVECLESRRWCLCRPDDGTRPEKEEDLRTWDRTVFSKDCLKHFWEKDEGAIKALPELVYDGPADLSREEAEKAALLELVECGRKWRKYAKANKYKYRLVSDCAVFDFGNTDQMILEYLPETKGMLHIGNWNGSVRCITSKEETILGVVDNYWRRNKKKTGSNDITVRLHELYGVPKGKFEHTHLPDDDAKNTGWRYLTAVAIENGVYTLNTKLVEEGSWDDLALSHKKSKLEKNKDGQ